MTKKNKLINHPTRLADMAFDDYYEDIFDNDGNKKIHRLEVKRWRKLKHQLT